ncbi:MAG: hypothetical protein L3J41_10875 [Melioribacteraceae bacterium]|nr:hypothetical protein [Melioribacteraceae bacterium]
MTIITIKNDEKLSRTQFENLEDLLNWAGSYFIENLPLSEEIIDMFVQSQKQNVLFHFMLKFH